MLQNLSQGRLLEDQSQRRAALHSSLSEWMHGIALEFEVAEQKMRDELAKMSVELREYADGLCVNAKVDGASELESFHKRIKEMFEKHLNALQGHVEDIVECERTNIHELAERFAVEAIDELNLLKKTVLSTLNQRLGSEIEETERYVVGRMDVIRQHSVRIADEVVKDLERDMQDGAKDIIGQLKGSLQSTHRKLESSMNVEMKLEYDALLNLASQNLNDLLKRKTTEFSEQAAIVVKDLSATLRRDVEERLTETRREHDVLAKAATSDLQQRLAEMSEEVMSGVASTRAVLSELKNVKEREERLRGVLVEIQGRVDAGEDNIIELEAAFKKQAVAVEQTLQNIDKLVVKTEDAIVGLQERANAALWQARTIIEQQIPARTGEIIASGRSQAFLEAKAEATKDIHLVLRGLYAELRMVEREVRQQFDAIKKQTEAHEKTLKDTAKSSGNDLTEQVKAWLS